LLSHAFYFCCIRRLPGSPGSTPFGIEIVGKNDSLRDGFPLPLKTKIQARRIGDIVADRRIGAMRQNGFVMLAFAETPAAESAR
jgi:hypothetical protein